MEKTEAQFVLEKVQMFSIDSFIYRLCIRSSCFSF